MLNKTTLSAYRRYLQAQKLEPQTIKNYLWHVSQFLKWLQNRPLSDKTLQNYFDYLVRRQQKVSSINLRLISVNKYLKFIKYKYKFGLLTLKPEPKIFLTKNQLQNFLAAPLSTRGMIGKRDKALLELLYSTGLKVRQVSLLKRRQIDLISHEIILDKTHVMIPALAWTYLQKYLETRHDKNDWLFINHDRAQKGEANLTVRSIERIIEKYARKLRPVLKVNPQILRNTLAHNLKKSGAQSQDIKKALRFKHDLTAVDYLAKI